ncbi:YsnF/AvaK domain-containing protein [Microvirga lenta]|uniref:YsnF/AvaK domain-containing protein n=1 Tax=Microvirga lenta TaxID=2881337 RepID=UPI00299D223D|nr:YsnF/AvaK domain-containing protein [Microvirga lenta]
MLPIAEEGLHFDKHAVTTGRVRVRTITDVASEMAQATLAHETVEVTRIPVDRVADEAPAVRTENDVTIVPALEEVLVVEKQLVLKEEMHIRRRVETEDVEVPVKLRKQRAVVPRLSPCAVMMRSTRSSASSTSMSSRRHDARKAGRDTTCRAPRARTFPPRPSRRLGRWSHSAPIRATGALGVPGSRSQLQRERPRGGLWRNAVVAINV